MIKFEHVDKVCALGADALIMQDAGMLARVRQRWPDMPIHASTQMHNHNDAALEYVRALGAVRAVLAREMTLEQIRSLRSPIEKEVFVHGALCFSVSGQCLMSAFLGGRSANRGGCAGPCRLPFRAEAGGEAFAGGAQRPPAGNCHHLSLKDLSILKALPRLAQLGVASAKIEGRLRGPEYVAAVVDAALKARGGEPYDEAFLRDVFSRSGFTDGWFTGQGGAGMFGVRTEADTAATKAALPKARDLYRRERPRVPVALDLEIFDTGARLTASDGTHEGSSRLPRHMPVAEKDPVPALRTALAKTGGTPFDVRHISIDNPGGYFLAAQEAATLRRGALDGLMAVREVLVPHRFRATTPAEMMAWLAVQPPPFGPQEAWPQAATPATDTISAAAPHLQGALKPHDTPLPARPALRARFAAVAKVPPEAAGLCAQLVLPLAEAAQVPAEWRPKTLLELPRVLFGRQEADAARLIEAARPLGFAGFEAQNIAHWALCAGLPLAAGFGLNLANALAVAAAGRAGCGVVTLSPELSLVQMRALVAEAAQSGLPVTFDALAYGHLPLMLTRACPMKQVTDCGACPGHGTLADRTGAAFPLNCAGGVSTVYNPVPLWMADRLAELPTHWATLYFTGESPQQAAGVLADFAARRAAPGPFTRGLYTRGTEA